jgi:two-component system, sensor histidine kinase RegB
MLVSSLLSASSDSQSRSRYLRLLCWIRIFAVGGQIGAILVAQFRLQLQMDYSLLWILISGLVLLIAYSWYQSGYRSGQQKLVSEPAYGLNLTLEIIGFSILIYLSGGATNPFVFYYLVPLAVGVATLSRGNAWMLCGLCIASYTLLLFQYQPLEIFDMSHGMVVSWRSPHILGMWMNFIVSALLITYFVSRMADQIRSQERVLAGRDQQQREDEHLLAMGTFAAGTAHELGTPLSSLAIILQDLSQQIGLDEEQKSELEIACGEVDRCKTILQRLVSAAHSAQNSSRYEIGVAELLDQLIDQAKNLFANAEIELQLAEPVEALHLEVDTALQQSLLNLLANSIESSQSAGTPKIEIAAQPVAGSKLTISLRDFGVGVPEEVLAKLGRQLVSQKTEGLGMGYFLANASINRVGGRLSIRNLQEGGAETLIELPLVTEDAKALS